MRLFGFGRLEWGWQRAVCGGLAAVVCAAVAAAAEVADDAPAPVEHEAAEEAIREAVGRGLAVVEKAARTYPEHRSCFSCHHQTLPLLAMTTARDRGLEIDGALVGEIAAFSRETFASRIGPMREGKGIGGESMTVAYGLWTHALAGDPADQTTEAMAEFLLVRQEEGGHWKRTTERPPLEESNHFATMLAGRWLRVHAGGAAAERVEDAIRRADAWFDVSEARSQEDVNAVLWRAVERHEDDPGEKTRGSLESARRAVLGRQMADGGWGQGEGMASDAYATGQTLYILGRAGMTLRDPEARRAARFLLESQCADGSWFVRSRSVPIQKFFDNGDPHGKDQFISIPATAWAVAALAASLPDPETDPPPARDGSSAP